MTMNKVFMILIFAALLVLGNAAVDAFVGALETVHGVRTTVATQEAQP